MQSPHPPEPVPGRGTPLWRAFTLIELLVVIAIIAVIASILFPVFAKVRWHSKNAACLSNLRQLHFVLQGYAEDFDDHYPFGDDTFWGEEDNSIPSPRQTVRTVVGARAPAELWHCPADLGYRWWGTNANGGGQYIMIDYAPSCFITRGQSYDYNLLMAYNRATGKMDPVNVSSVDRPSEIAVLKDAHFEWHNNNSPLNPATRSKSDPGAWNVLYLDGHAQRLVTATTLSTQLYAWWVTKNDPRN